MKINKVPLIKESYYAEAHPKDSIFLHHTQGHNRPDWVIKSWGRERATSTNKIRSGVSYVIGGTDILTLDENYDGIIAEAFKPNFWSHHLYIKAKSNTFLNQKSIGIEICNYGDLINTLDGEFYTSTNIPIDPKYVIELNEPFRGSKYFHSYTESQIESLRLLLLKLAKEFEIDLAKGLKRELNKTIKEMPKFHTVFEGKKWLNHNGFTDNRGKRLHENNREDSNYTQAAASVGKSAFDLAPNALKGYPGLWSHTNVRIDKKGIYPHPLIIELINSF